MKNSKEGTQKVKNGTTIYSNNSTSEYISEKKKINVLIQQTHAPKYSQQHNL